MLTPSRFLLLPLARCLVLGALLLLFAGTPAFGQANKKRPAPAPSGKPAPSPAAVSDLPEVVAIVNGIPIPRQEVEKPAEAVLASQGRTLQSVAEADRRRVYRSVLEDAIVRHLVAAPAAGEPVSDADVDKQFAAFGAQYRDQAAFDADLKKNGQTAEQFRATLRLQLAQQRWVERQIAEEIKVSPEEIARFYKDSPPGKFESPESVHASHILVAVRKDAPPEDALDAENKANELLARIKKGEPFDAVAKQASEDPHARITGGDLGEITRGKIMPEFADAAFKLKNGEVGGPVRTQLGYHLIKVLDHQPAHAATLDEVRDQIAAYLESTKRQAAAAKLIQGLRDNATVEVFLAGA